MIEDLQNIITFLEENEQYGDDWQKEIQTLKEILETLEVWHNRQHNN